MKSGGKALARRAAFSFCIEKDCMANTLSHHEQRCNQKNCFGCVCQNARPDQVKMKKRNDGSEERIERSLVERGRLQRSQSLCASDEIKERINAVNRHGEHGNENQTQYKPSQPAPIQLKQEGERQNDRRTFEMHSQRQRSARKEKIASDKGAG